jgi:hypothetical protein
VVDALDIDTSKKSGIIKTLRNIELKKSLTEAIGTAVLQSIRSSIAKKSTLGSQFMGYNNSITAIDIQIQRYTVDSAEYRILANIKKILHTEKQLFLRDIFSRR